MLPQSFLIGKSLQQLKHEVRTNDPFASVPKVCIAVIATTKGYVKEGADEAKYEWCFLGFLVIYIIAYLDREFFVERVLQVVRSLPLLLCLE